VALNTMLRSSAVSRRSSPTTCMPWSITFSHLVSTERCVRYSVDAAWQADGPRTQHAARDGNLDGKLA